MMSMRSRSETYRSAATSSRFACGVWLERDLCRSRQVCPPSEFRPLSPIAIYERVGGQRRVARYSRVGKIACAPQPVEDGRKRPDRPRNDDMAGDFAHPTPTSLQKPRRPHQRAPHVRRGRVVEAEALLRLLEIAAAVVDEILE